ncbi:hypothetical protein INS90_08765 [Trueperella pecoris]|uniref:ABC-2 family transporter protein n=1 Tax=Trueperella pecoris TaxID=2733571 RepID=A0A7M1R1N1_9ACTO|nr:hypothetical protein [Trueperella pecoris]QOR47337.1 hypothetical protein INS90_08765 [Trueperella pecoris]
MWINKYERDLLLGFVGALVFIFVASAGFIVFASDSLQVSLFTADWIGEIRTATEEKTVWNSVAGVYGFSLLGAGFLSGYFAAQIRAYLGAGMTRMQIFVRLTRLGLLTVVLWTALVALFWGAGALVKRPELTGVEPVNLIMIPLWVLLIYMATMFAVALFVRFAWWKVLLGGAVVNAVAGGTIAYASNRGASIHLEQSAVPVAFFLVAALCWIATWAAIRTLPIRRG